jgi:hypothetical protein
VGLKDRWSWWAPALRGRPHALPPRHAIDPPRARLRRADARRPRSTRCSISRSSRTPTASGKRQAALATLEGAVHLQPDNSETWRRLGRYRLSVLNDPKGALRAFRAAYFLDPQSARGPSDYLEAARAVRAGG